MWPFREAIVGLAAVLVVQIYMRLRTDPSVVIPTGGYTAPGFDSVMHVFSDNFESGIDSLSGGSAFAVYYEGRKVVDIWAGYADTELGQRWKKNTLTLAHSTTKGVAALCIAMLVDRGLLDYERPVALYWPEFGQKGKGKITVRQMMEHKAGLLLAPPPGLSLDVLVDVAEAGRLMAASEPQWEVDGEAQGYQAFTIGILTNELLRRVDKNHRTMGHFISAEIAKPFDVDFFLGLPLEENYRVARAKINTTPIFLRLLMSLFSPEWRQENLHLLTDIHMQRMVENAGDIGEFHRLNDPSYRALELASVNGLGTAEAQAKLYGILAAGGTDLLTNRTLLSRSLVDAFSEGGPSSIDKVLGLHMSYARGMMVQKSMTGGVMFGHVGAGGQLSFADPENKIGFSFQSSYQMPVIAAKHQRSINVIKSILPPLPSVVRWRNYTAELKVE